MSSEEDIFIILPSADSFDIVTCGGINVTDFAELQADPARFKIRKPMAGKGGEADPRPFFIVDRLKVAGIDIASYLSTGKRCLSRGNSCLNRKLKILIYGLRRKL